MKNSAIKISIIIVAVFFGVLFYQDFASAKRDDSMKLTWGYGNLEIGKEYIGEVSFIDKDSQKPMQFDGEELTKEVAFTPNKASGDIEISFPVGAKFVHERNCLVSFTVSQNGKTVMVTEPIPVSELYSFFVVD